MIYKNKNIFICCPSYKRPKVETLKYIPFCRVYVSPEEYQEYKNKNKGADIVKCAEGIQGNVSRVRNYILEDSFNNGADIVCIVDDDLKKIERFEMSIDCNFAYERAELKTDQFIDFVYKYSMLCEEWGFKFWGINVNADAMSFRHYSPFSTVSPVLGPFSVFLKGNKCRYDENLPLKEDYDMFIQNCNEYRGVLRLNAYHYKCKQSEQVGGCAMYRNMEREKEQFEKLQKKWGHKIVKLDDNNRRKIKKDRKYIDYNPIIKIPINGI